MFPPFQVTCLQVSNINKLQLAIQTHGHSAVVFVCLKLHFNDSTKLWYGTLNFFCSTGLFSAAYSRSDEKCRTQRTLRIGTSQSDDQKSTL